MTLLHPSKSDERCLMCIIIMIIATGRSSCLNKWRYVLFNLKIREAHCAYVERIMMDFRGTNDMAWGGSLKSIVSTLCVTDAAFPTKD